MVPCCACIFLPSCIADPDKAVQLIKAVPTSKAPRPTSNPSSVFSPRMINLISYFIMTQISSSSHGASLSIELNQARDVFAKQIQSGIPVYYVRGCIVQILRYDLLFFVQDC